MQTNTGVIIPTIEDITPAAGVEDFRGEQPYHLVLVGEKSSLADVLDPVAEQYRADLYCMTGELSDTRIWEMACDGDRDGRRMVVLYFSDCDPAGWQMPISVARKLQALKIVAFPDLDFRVDRVALTPDQVKANGLPSTPLKQSESRSRAWVNAMGVLQTEIDALAALQPDLLRAIAVEAIAPFYDSGLAVRVEDAADEWQRRAQRVIDERIEPRRNDLREAATQLETKRVEIQAILDSARIYPDDLEGYLPEPEVPDAQLDGEPDNALCDSDWHFITQCRALISAKNYEEYERDDDYWWWDESYRRRATWSQTHLSSRISCSSGLASLSSSPRRRYGGALWEVNPKSLRYLATW